MYLHVIRSDSEEILRRTLTMDKEDFLIWSEDGTRLYRFGAASDGGLQAYSLTLSSQSEFEQTALWPDISAPLTAVIPAPTGRFLLIQNAKDDTITLFDLKAGTATALPIEKTDLLASVLPQWTPDGQAIAYYDGDSAQVHVVDKQGAALLTAHVPQFSGDDLQHLSISDAPYLVVAEFERRRCVLTNRSTYCIALSGIHTASNAIRP
jgi:hypothetical protein